MNDVGRIMDNLKPCPFCGGKAGRLFYTESVESPFKCIITCADCGASLEVIDTANDLKTTQNLAIDKWNTRLKKQDNLKQKIWNALYAEEDELEKKFVGTEELHNKWFYVYRPWLQRGFEIAIGVIAEQDGM